MASQTQYAGLARFATLCAAASWWVGWGTGTAAARSATALTTPAAEARVSGTPTTITTSQTGDTFKVTGTITSASGQTITEVGAFDALSSGNCDLYGSFTGVALSTGDSIAFTITCQFT